MWVTCYADASFGDGRGAWAVWLRCSEGRAIRRGPCPSYVKDSNAAELAALFAGVHISIALWGERVTGISLRSDCKGALDLAAPDAPLHRKPAFRRLQEKLRATALAHGIELERRWVKGHQPVGSGAAAYLNRECDRLARKTRRKKASRDQLTPGA